MPYIGNTIRAADDYRLIDDISSSFNGSTTSFALQVAGSSPVPFPKSPQQVLISVNGVIQEPDPTGSSGFNLVGTNIVFSSAPTNGHAFFGIIYATADYLNAGGNFPSGSLGAPSFTFIGDENTGLYRKSGGSVGFVSDATEIANFDSNGITISSGNLILGDSASSSSDRVVLGASSDLSIYHDGSHSRIDETGTGNLMIQTNNEVLVKKGTSENIASFNVDGAVELYHDNVKQFETISTGFKSIAAGNRRITIGSTDASGAMLVLDGDSNGDGSGNDYAFIQHNTDGEIQIENYKSASIRFATAGVDRYKFSSVGHFVPAADSTYDIGTNTVRVRNGYFDTLYGDGSNLTGISSVGGATGVDFNDTVKARFGNSNDFEVFHNGSSNNTEVNHTTNTGHLQITSNRLKLMNYDGPETYIDCTSNAGVDIYFNNARKLSTKSTGIEIPGNCAIELDSGNWTGNHPGKIQHHNNYLYLQGGTNGFIFMDDSGTGTIFIDSSGHLRPATDNTYDCGTSTHRWRNVFTADLNLSNKGSQNDVDSTWGDYTIQEGFEDLFLINNRTGKRFKFNLTEVS